MNSKLLALSWQQNFLKVEEFRKIGSVPIGVRMGAVVALKITHGFNNIWLSVCEFCDIFAVKSCAALSGACSVITERRVA